MATKVRRIPVPDTERNDCSCCGAEGTPTYPVYRAGMVDADNVYFPRLCGGCFDGVEAELAKIAAGTYDGHDFGAAKRMLAPVAAEVLGDDDDGIEAMLGDVA